MTENVFSFPHLVRPDRRLRVRPSLFPADHLDVGQGVGRVNGGQVAGQGAADVVGRETE